MNFAARNLTPDKKASRPYHHSSAWTPEKVARLRLLWEDRALSAAAIAVKLGFSSKNSVIGKANRLGLPPRLDRIATMLRRERSAEEREKRALLKASRPPVSAPTAPEPDPAPDSLGLKIWELRDGQCRYIDGLPNVTSVYDLGYCGHGVAPGDSWCPYHKKLCTEPPSAKQAARFRYDVKKAIKNG